MLAVVKMVKKIIDMSNTNCLKMWTPPLKKNINQEVKWIGKDKKHLPDNRYKISY